VIEKTTGAPARAPITTSPPPSYSVSSDSSATGDALGEVEEFGDSLDLDDDLTPAVTPKLEAALELKAEGFDIIKLYHVTADGACSCLKGPRCKTPGKHPNMGLGWQTKAPLSVPDLYAEWDDDPEANIGIRCGSWSAAAAGGAVVALDEDRAGALEEIAEQVGAEILDSRTHRSGSGNRHLLLSLPEGVSLGNSDAPLPSGVNVRCQGGQIVAPGSITDKGEYKVIKDVPIREAPAALIELLQPAAKTETQFEMHEVAPEDLNPVQRAYLDKVVAGELSVLDELRINARPDWKPGDGGPSWGWTCQKVAFRLIEVANTGGQYTSEQLLQAFLEHAPHDAGFGRDAAKAHWKSAYNKVKNKKVKFPASTLTDLLGNPIGHATSDRSTVSGPQDSPWAGPDPSDPSDPPTADSGPQGSAGQQAGQQAGPGPQAGTAPPTEKSSWEPEDLSEFIDGDPEPVEPCLWKRQDGLMLLYPGRVHALYGESESGKSLVMQAEAAEVIKRGGYVCIIDFESTATTVIPRLKKMGVTGQQIAKQLWYIRPETDPRIRPIDQVAWEAICAQNFDLIIWDGVNESLSTVGASMNENDDYNAWLRNMPRKLAQRTGAPVVLIDHVVKDAEKRGRYGIGTVAKLNTLDGASYTLEVVDPLGRGMRGELLLWLGKDREGAIKPHQVDYNPKTRLGKIAKIVVDSRVSGTIKVELLPPTSDTSGERGTHADPLAPLWPLMQKISEALLESRTAGNDEPQKTATLQKIGGNKGKLDDAFEALRRRGYVKVRQQGNVKRVRLVQPFWEANARLGEQGPASGSQPRADHDPQGSNDYLDGFDTDD
jgi:bifunctional DNA primase/polymerase-like protein/AAA domain-containing protein